MERGRFPPVRSSRSFRSLSVPFAVLALVALLMVPVSAAARPSAWSDPPGWGNGTVYCTFGGATPLVTVSPAASIGAGLMVGTTTIEEVAPTGSLVASATAAAASWSIVNASSEDTFDLEYAAAVPVVPSGALERVVPVEVNFTLPAYGGSSSRPGNVVTMTVSLSGWPWQSSADHLVLTLALASGTGGEHLVQGSSPGVIESVSNATGDTISSLSAGAAGNASTGGSSPVPLPAATTAALYGTSGVLTISFAGSVAYDALSYATTVSVTLPASVAGLPLSDYVIVGSVAAVIVIVAGVGVRRVRRRPSDLVFAEEERP